MQPEKTNLVKKYAPRIELSIILGLLLRLFLLLSIRIHTGNLNTTYSYDTQDYLTPAQNWLKTGLFVNHGLPELYRTPGYPLFLIPGILLGHIEIVTIVLQIAISTLGIFLLYKTIKGLDIFEKPARWAAFLYACEPVTILYTNKLLTETLFTFTVLLFCLVLVHYFHHRQIIWILLSSGIMAAAVYVRPAGYFLPIFLTFIILLLDRFIYRKTTANRTPMSHLFVFLALSMGLIGLWQWRNFSETGYSGFSTVDGKTIYFFHGASVEAANRKIPLHDLQDQMGYRDPNVYWQLHPEQKSWTEAQINRYMTDEGIKMILSNLPRFSIIYALGLGRTLLDPSANEYLRLFNAYSLPGGVLGVGLDRGFSSQIRIILDIFKTYPTIFLTNLLLGLIIILYYLLALIASIQRSTWHNKSLVCFLSLGFYLLIVAGGGIGADRFRVPIMPILCILAGSGLWKIIESYQRYRMKHLLSLESHQNVN
jgi:4-amino-4-deoxy-L-arabinose transferase-like glycosyltransferase